MALAISAGLCGAAPALAQDAGSEFVILSTDLDAPGNPDPFSGGSSNVTPAVASPAATKPATTIPAPVKKVVNGSFGVAVDNGWVIYEGTANNPTLSFWNTTANGNFNATVSIKLSSPPGVTPPNQGGPYFSAGGIVFVPGTSGKSQPSQGGSGFGLGFGEIFANGGGAGSSNGGWVDDTNAVPYPSDPNFGIGATADLAVDPSNGAYAVGWDQVASPGNTQGFIIKLGNSLYQPVSRTNLGTLGGLTSQALGISKNAAIVVGTAEDVTGKMHAVFAPTNASHWTDLTPGWTSQILGSQANFANANGQITGTAELKVKVGGRTIRFEEGFVVNSDGTGLKYFDAIAAGADIVPKRILPNGMVVGNLSFVLPKGTPGSVLNPMHPFLFDGTNVIDLGLMTNPATGQPAYGCRISHVNGAGQVVGSCTANPTDTYGFAFAGFYMNPFATSPAFENLNTMVHANEDAGNPALVPYTLTNATWIDDEGEITLLGTKIQGGVANRASFLISANAYQP